MANLPSSSAIPGAVAALVTIATDALPAGTTVWYGGELPAYTAPLTLWISEVNGDQTPAELGLQYRREETFSIVCSLVVYQGGPPDFLDQLQSLMDSFALLSKTIGNNPWLSPDGTQANGTVRFAQVGNFRLQPATDGNGMGGTTLDFQIRCEQRILSLS